MQTRKKVVSHAANETHSHKTTKDRLLKLLKNNKKWASAQTAADPDYFNRLTHQQAPEYLWIGCSDSRVPANVIVGLEPGEVFVQRNVGNQAMHTDLNVMSCLEYAVTALKVKTIICCGHYGCGAVKAALSLPSKTPGLVNCWISDIRECRNQSFAELKGIKDNEERFNRLCELNVIRQTFHICTSPVVQNAWDQGQELSVYGCIYGVKDGMMRQLVGPLNQSNAGLSGLDMDQDLPEGPIKGIQLGEAAAVKNPAVEPVVSTESFEESLSDLEEDLPKTLQPASLPGVLPSVPVPYDAVMRKRWMMSMLSSYTPITEESEGDYEEEAFSDSEPDTKDLASKVAQHVGWSEENK